MTEETETLPLHEWLAREGKLYQQTLDLIQATIVAGFDVHNNELLRLSLDIAQSHATLCTALSQHPSIKFMDKNDG